MIVLTQQRRQRIRTKKSNVSGLFDGQNSKDLIRGSYTNENSTKRFFYIMHLYRFAFLSVIRNDPKSYLPALGVIMTIKDLLCQIEVWSS